MRARPVNGRRLAISLAALVLGGAVASAGSANADIEQAQTAFAPFVHVPADGIVRVVIANIGPDEATYVTTYRDRDSNVLKSRALTLAAGNGGTVGYNPPIERRVQLRPEILASDGSAFTFSTQVAPPGGAFRSESWCGWSGGPWRCGGPSDGTVAGSFVPIPRNAGKGGALLTVANVGAETATYDASWRDRDGKLLVQRTLTLKPNTAAFVRCDCYGLVRPVVSGAHFVAGAQGPMSIIAPERSNEWWSAPPGTVG